MKSNQISDETISQIDIMATLFSILGIEKPENSALDSYDMSDVWVGNKYESPIRDYTIHNTFEKKWGIRVGKWLFINDKSGEHTGMPNFYKEMRGYTDFDSPVLLFDMEQDPEQMHNLSQKFPDKVIEMQAKLDEVLARDYTLDKSE